MKLNILNTIVLVLALLVTPVSVFADQYVAVNQNAAANVPLVCSLRQGNSDDYVFKWYANDIAQPQFENQFEIDTSNLARGDSWKCEIVALLYNPITGNFITSVIGSDSTVVRNAIPVITSTPVPTGLASASYNYDVNAVDADGDLLTYAVVSGPAGMGINPTSGLIIWPSAVAGTYPITVSVTDGVDTVTQSYTLTVTGSSFTVVASATPSAGNAPLAVTFSSTVVGGTTPYTYAWDFENDGIYDVFSVSPVHIYATAGTYTARVLVTDATSASATDTVVVTVTTLGSLTVVANAAPTSGNAPLTVSFTSTVSGGTTPYTYAWDFNGDSVTDSTSASGSYTFSAAGTYNAVLRVTDATSATAQSTVTIVVSAAGTPVFSTTSCPDGEVDKTYTCDINAAGAGTLNYTLVSGPTGMTINPATGVVTWKPTGHGTFTFRVRATSLSTGLFAERTYTITIAESEEADEDDLFVEAIRFEVEDVSQGGVITAFVTMENQGDLDFEDLVLSMSINDLDVATATNKFDLNDGDKVTKELSMSLPAQVTDGYYLVKFTLKNDDVNIVKFRELHISGTPAAGSVTTASDVVFQQSVSGYQPPTQKAKLNWLGIWFLILLLLALLAMAAYLVRRLAEERKEEGISIVALDSDNV